MALQPQLKRPYVQLPGSDPEDPLAQLPKLGQLTPGQRSRLGGMSHPRPSPSQLAPPISKPRRPTCNGS
ncbi:hypothetical protein KBZ20_16370 [Vulcanococcus limneticus Candia 3F8]|uniref:hypothetical protein n=1 Tax=Vulcanococcus limneticus TaxID=2170428 RepID=UPI0020CEEEDD|nr:hypothetical protein [Vulcanococcus limneticus]MCP9793340.1 hypothetical protein [Vulcanococcus limneticus MW73D5]MCP9895342.1 hypothetical protein [Vulcanococcus limneticus Candia 3F8]MCP9898738.1 hypothetical protein [Vulcanococcus limneticus Candia 3B3]